MFAFELHLSYKPQVKTSANIVKGSQSTCANEKNEIQVPLECLGKARSKIVDKANLRLIFHQARMRVGRQEFVL